MPFHDAVRICQGPDEVLNFFDLDCISLGRAPVGQACSNRTESLGAFLLPLYRCFNGDTAEFRLVGSDGDDLTI